MSSSRIYVSKWIVLPNSQYRNLSTPYQFTVFSKESIDLSERGNSSRFSLCVRLYWISLVECWLTPRVWLSFIA